VVANESSHQLDARRILDHVDGDATRTKQVLLAEECLVLPDDDFRDAVQQNGAAAHGAWRQRRVEYARAIDAGRLASGVLQRIHLAVQDRAASLHAPVVAAADDAPGVNQHRADGDAAFAGAGLRFRDRRLHEFVGHVWNYHVCAGIRAVR